MTVAESADLRNSILGGAITFAVAAGLLAALMRDSASFAQAFGLVAFPIAVAAGACVFLALTEGKMPRAKKAKYGLVLVACFAAYVLLLIAFLASRA